MSAEQEAWDLKRRLVDMANGNQERMDGTMTPIWRIIDENELVFAIWQDEMEPDGVGMVIVKGAALLRGIAQASKGFFDELATSAIPCTSAEQAEALRQTCAKRGIV